MVIFRIYDLACINNINKYSCALIILYFWINNLQLYCKFMTCSFLRIYMEFTGHYYDIYFN